MALALSSRVEIAPGVLMPRLGFGTYRSAEGPEVQGAVEEALGAGYRGIDTASLYGNESGIGRAIDVSGIDRDELFVATKVWNSEQGYRSTLEALDRSLDRLGMDHVDLYLVHWPIAETMAQTWRAMEEALSAGRTRAIGVCNHLPHHLDALMETAEAAPAVDQVEFHPWLQQPDLQERLRRDGIVLQAWAPVIRGRIFDIPEAVAIARAHGVSPAQVAIRWILQLGHTTIPKSVHAERIRENADVFGFELTAEEMSVLGGLDRHQRVGPDPDRFAF